MSVSVHSLINQEMLIQLKGFKPAEKVDLTINTEYEQNPNRLEIYDIPIGPEGSASDREGLLATTGAPQVH
jgi:hypothetical protein